MDLSMRSLERDSNEETQTGAGREAADTNNDATSENEDRQARGKDATDDEEQEGIADGLGLRRMEESVVVDIDGDENDEEDDEAGSDDVTAGQSGLSVDFGRFTNTDVVVDISDDEADELLASESMFYRQARRRTRRSSMSPDALVKSETLKVYFKEIGRVGLLTQAEEIDLSKRYQAGVKAELALEEREDEMSPEEIRRNTRLAEMGFEAKRQMVASNLRLVVSIAKRYQHHGMGLIDLIQSGNMGLIRAVEKFDYTKGFKLSTYATWWIRQSVTRAIADQSRTIRVPVHLLDSINKMKRAKHDLSQRYNREPTVEELAAEMDTTVEKVEDMIRNLYDASSLDNPVGEDEGASVGDLIEDETAERPFSTVDNDALHETLLHIAEDLDEREYTVIMCRYGIDGTKPMTLEAIGKEMGVTRERIRQIESKALAKLRHPIHSKLLVDFMFMLSDESKEW